MDIAEVLGVGKAVRLRGAFTQERAQIAQFAWDTGVALILVGLKAAKTFPTPKEPGPESKLRSGFCS